MNKPFVNVVGYLSIDTIDCPAGRFENVPGGAACYCASSAARAGACVRLFASAGEDYPQRALDLLTGLGVETSGVARVAGPSRRSRLHDPSGRDRTLLHVSDPIWWEATERTAPPVPDGRGVFVYTAMPPSILSRQIGARHSSDMLIGDTSGAYAGAYPRELLALVPQLSVFAPSREETRQLLPNLNDDAALDRLATRVELVVQKRGADGLVLKRRGEAPHVQPSLADAVVDTTGAGDSVVGALAAALAAGLDDKAALLQCARIAAMTVAGVGLEGLQSRPAPAQGGCNPGKATKN